MSAKEANAPTLGALIVDDEAPARTLLRELLAEHPEVEVVGEASNGFEAVKVVAALSPDVIFLDIQMPKLDGFEVLELLGEDRPSVVFVTAFDEYALRAFEVHALDYLLKPIEPERLAGAVRRLSRSTSPPSDEVVGKLVRDRRAEDGDRRRPIDRVLVRDGDQIHVVAAPRIDYIEAQDDYVLLVAGEKRLRKQQTLGELGEQLDPRAFVRIHRSYLLQVDRLTGLERYAKDSRVAILHDGTRLPVSRSGYARLRELL